ERVRADIDRGQAARSDDDTGFVIAQRLGRGGYGDFRAALPCRAGALVCGDDALDRGRDGAADFDLRPVVLAREARDVVYIEIVLHVERRPRRRAGGIEVDEEVLLGAARGQTELALHRFSRGFDLEHGATAGGIVAHGDHRLWVRPFAQSKARDRN